MEGLLLVERFVLENVGIEGATIGEVSERTQLKPSLVQNVLYHLKSLNIVQFSAGMYSLNMREKESWQKYLALEGSKKLEIMDLFSQLLNFYYQSEKKQVDLKLERAHMNEFEYKIFQSHLTNIKDFFKGIKKQPKSLAKKNEYVFLYANSNFPSLVKASLA